MGDPRVERNEREMRLSAKGRIRSLRRKDMKINHFSRRGDPTRLNKKRERMKGGIL